jgi:hypothetical protein
MNGTKSLSAGQKIASGYSRLSQWISQLWSMRSVFLFKIKMIAVNFPPAYLAGREVNA